jgi:hypothetical protein
MNCERDWFNKFGEQALNHFGRIHEPIKLTEDEAWFKFRDWRSDEDRYYFRNRLNDQCIRITEQQYNDDSFTRPRRSTVVVVEATDSKGKVIQKDTLHF